MSRSISPKVFTRRAIGVIAATSAVVALSLAGSTAATAASSPDRVSFAGAVPAWATRANDVGAAVPTDNVEGEFFLPLRNSAAATALATAVSTPGSPGYRHPLTPKQWIATFSPTQADVNEVVAYLTSQKLTISAIPASRQYVIFRGTAAAVGGALGTSLHRFNHAGSTLVAPSSAPTLPAALTGKVSGVSIDQSRTLTRPSLVKQGSFEGTSSGRRALNRMVVPAPPIPRVCSQYDREHVVTVPPAYGKTQYSTFNCGYTPAQLRSAYGVSGLVAAGANGQGQTVAIVDAYASPSIVKDVNTYSTALGEPALTAATYSQIVPKPSEFNDQELCGLPSGWQGEQTLDVEAVHGIAPGAHVLYVGGFNCEGGIDIAVSKILDNKLANIVSNSYGNTGEALPLDTIQGQVNIELQAAGEGIGLYYSSGDNGDETANLGYASPDFSASSPWVTAVGGTSMGISKAGAITYETGWGDTLDQIVKDSLGRLAYVDPLPGTIFAGGAGGGRSAIFDQPAYQKGIVPLTLSKGNRVSPDISALADPYTGFLIGISPITDDTTLQTGTFENETYGGTSLASPLTAAQMAIVQQVSHTAIGFANPTLYALYRVAPIAFRDVLPLNPRGGVEYSSATSGHSFLVTFDTDTSLHTAPKYDDVTGLGGVSFGLLSQLAAGRH